MGQSQSATLQSVGQTVTNTSNEVYMGMGQMCTYRRAPRPEAASDKGAEQHPSVLFGALAYADPLDLVSAFVQARELGDYNLAVQLCAEDLHFEYGSVGSPEFVEVAGRDTIAQEMFGTPAPGIPKADLLKPLHVAATGDGGRACVVARELRLQRFKLRQEYTVISLKGWRNAMQILRITVSRELLQEEAAPAAKDDAPATG